MEQGCRECSRCEKCGKRIAYLGPAQPRPCPDDAASPYECREVKEALIRARQITSVAGKELHAETVDLMRRSGWTLDQIDAALAERERVLVDERTFRLDMDAKNVLADWINGDRGRAMIVAKWALDQIDVTAGGIRNICAIGDEADEIAREIKEHAEGLADQYWEFEDA